jgi:Protein of unknown function (DUF3293)
MSSPEQHSSSIDTLTLAAYRETEFRALVSGFTLLVDEHCPALAQALHAQDVSCAAFVAAVNPYSVQCPASDNARRHAALGSELSLRSLHYEAGLGLHPSGNWPGEESFLVYGLALEASRTLGLKYEQNAIVWAGADAVPRLILLR